MKRMVFATLLSLAAMLFMGAPASADPPPVSTCSEDQWGDIITINYEDWICAYDAELGIYFWEPADWAFPAESEYDNFFKYEFGAQFATHVRSRLEYIPQFGGIKTGADVYSRRNGVAWTSPGLAHQSQLYSWNGSSWTLCRDTGIRYSSGAASELDPTIAHFSACGLNRWYGSWGTGHQWTGSSWLSGSVWSGSLFVSSGGSLTHASRADVTPPADVPPPPQPPPPPDAPLLPDGPLPSD